MLVITRFYIGEHTGDLPNWLYDSEIVCDHFRLKNEQLPKSLKNNDASTRRVRTQESVLRKVKLLLWRRRVHRVELLYSKKAWDHSG